MPAPGQVPDEYVKNVFRGGVWLKHRDVGGEPDGWQLFTHIAGQP